MRGRGEAGEEGRRRGEREEGVRAEEVRRGKEEEEDDRRSEEKRRLDGESRERRLVRIEAMETAAEEAAEGARTERARATRRIDADVLRAAAKAEANAKHRREEEALLNLEDRATAKLRSLMIDRTVEDREGDLRQMLEVRREGMERDDKILMDRLTVEDEERRLVV